MKIIRALTALPVLALLPASAGCSAAGASPQAESSADLRPATADELVQLHLPPGVEVVGALPTIEVNRSAGVRLEDDVQGGGGGKGPYYLSDYYYWAFNGRSGSYVDQVTFEGYSGWSQAFGLDGGKPIGEVDCPMVQGTQTRWVGFTGRSGSYIDALGPACAIPGQNVIEWVTFGGGGGQPFNYTCPGATWVIGWAVRAGNYVDSLTVFCGTGPI